MNRFTFKRGTWEDGTPFPAWEDNEEFNDYLGRIGFGLSRAMYGHEYGGNIEIYESSDGKSFYANVSPAGDTCFEVFLPDFPSMMMFIRDHAAAFSASSLNYVQQETLELLQKLFQLQHGHPASSICPQCDPEGWSKNMRAREERRKKQEVKG